MLFGKFNLLPEFFITEVRRLIGDVGITIRSKIPVTDQLMNIVNIVGVIIAVRKYISLILKMIDGYDILIYRIINIRNIQVTIFFLNLHIFKVSYSIIGDITNK